MGSLLVKNIVERSCGHVYYFSLTDQTFLYFMSNHVTSLESHTFSDHNFYVPCYWQKEQSRSLTWFSLKELFKTYLQRTNFFLLGANYRILRHSQPDTGNDTNFFLWIVCGSRLSIYVMGMRVSECSRCGLQNSWRRGKDRRVTQINQNFVELLLQYHKFVAVGGRDEITEYVSRSFSWDFFMRQEQTVFDYGVLLHSVIRNCLFLPIDHQNMFKKNVKSYAIRSILYLGILPLCYFIYRFCHLTMTDFYIGASLFTALVICLWPICNRF